MAASIISIDWQGITLSVEYEPHWRGNDDLPAHLQIKVLAPEGAQIPITETGYRSQFIGHEHIVAAGGPGEFVLGWLDEAADLPEWRRRCEAARQLSLF